jgi:hypothetical protein
MVWVHPEIAKTIPSTIGALMGARSFKPIFIAPTCTTLIIPFEPCALNVEIQHFILRFNKNILTLWIPLKEGLGIET